MFENARLGMTFLTDVYPTAPVTNVMVIINHGSWSKTTSHVGLMVLTTETHHQTNEDRIDRHK